MNIEEKVKDLLNKKELIPKEYLKQLFENKKKNIASFLLDSIFKNNLKIYNINNENFKNYIEKKFKEASNIDNLLSVLDKYKEFSKNYQKDTLFLLKSFSDELFNSVFIHYKFKLFIHFNVLGVKLLFHYKDSEECLTFIRQVSDLRAIDNSCLNHSVSLIYNYLQNIFRYSKRLMTYIFVDNIFRAKILKNLEKKTFYSRLSIIENENEDDNFLKIIYKNGAEIKELLAIKKEIGINSGLIFKIDKNKYYIKTFHNGLKMKGSYESLILDYQFSSDSLSWKEESKKLIINIFEPLEYFILEQLEYGPKVEIIINPYVNEGLYIVSKDIEENGNKFYLFKDINEKIKNNIINEKDLINNNNLAISLNEMEIISKILGITDLNFGNFGFLEDEKINIDNKYDNVKIIDFIPSKNNFNNNCYNDLISRKSYGIDLTGKSIIGRILITNDSNNKNQFLFKAFQKVKNKLKDKNLQEILERSLAQLISILETERGNNTDEVMLMCPYEFRKRKNYEFLGFQNMDSNLPNYYPNVKSELESYIKNIINNFNEIEKNLNI